MEKVGRGRQAKPPACKMPSWQNAEELGSAAVPRAREGVMKKQPEWGKDCLLQTCCDLSLTKTGFPF